MLALDGLPLATAAAGAAADGAAAWPGALLTGLPLLALAGAALWRERGRRARETAAAAAAREELASRCAALDAALAAAVQERDAARHAAAAAARQVEVDQHKLRRAGARAQSLERILQVVARLNATRSPHAVLEEIVEAVRESLGFRMVLLRIWSPATQTFEARAFAGISAEGQAHLSGLQVNREQYEKLTQPRFRLSQSYFISHEDEAWADATAGGYTADLGQRAEGEWHEDDMLIVPLQSAEGEVRGYLSVDDPDDRRVPSLEVVRQLELFAAQAVTAIESAELYDRLARNNLELARASEMLKQLNEMKGNFVANVSHELRTPLTSIKAYTETLVHNRHAMPDEVREEFLAVIHQESEKLTTIIDNILDLSRLDGGAGRARREECDLAEIVRQQAEAARTRAAAKEIELRVDVPAGEVRLAVAPAQIAQVVDQLLDNACKFTPAGGAVRLALHDGIAAVELQVEDSGIGVPPDKMDYIFDRFYQVDGSSTREHGGQGVGLAICRDIVEWHEGRIWVENRRPCGCRFRVVLPRRNEVAHHDGLGVTWPALHDPQEFMEKLVHWVGEAVGVRNVSLMLADPAGEHLVVAAAAGLPESVVRSTRLRRGEGIAGKVWASGRSLLVRDIAADERLGKRQNAPQYATPSLLSVPLFEGMDCLGVLNVNNRLDGRPFTDDDRILLEALSPRLSHLLGRMRAYLDHVREFAALREALRTASGVRRARHDGLTAISHEICLATARRLKLPAEDIEHLALALQVFDVGLSRLSEQLLRKAEPLTTGERDLVRQHVRQGLDILAPLQFSPRVRQIILHHHERADGAGYPDGLEGEAIPVGARLLALADCLGAMLQGRPYRAPLPLDTALAEIESLAGSQFCPRLVGPFVAEARLRACRIRRLQAAAGASGADDGEAGAGAAAGAPAGEARAAGPPAAAVAPPERVPVGASSGPAADR